MQATTSFFIRNETKVNLSLTQQIGPDDNIRLRGADSYTFSSSEEFHKGLMTVLNMLFGNVERFYNAMEREVCNNLITEAEREESRKFNSIKFELVMQGALQGKSLNVNVVNLNDLCKLAHQYGIKFPEKILDILNLSDETSAGILFYPERGQKRFCNVI